MSELLSIEWLKIKSYKTFWVLIGFFALLLPFWNYGIANGFMKFGSGDLNFVSQAYSFGNVWQNLGFWTSIFVVFISILIIILTTNEFQFRTNRQNVIDGWKHLDFYHAKWLLVLVLSAFTVIYVFLIGLIFGLSYSSFNDFPGNISYLFFTWVLALNYYSFSLLLALLLKKSGIAISMFFLYSMILESLLSKGINWLSHSLAGNFLPLQCSDELLPFPLLDMVKRIANLSDSVTPTWYVLASFGWIIIYYFVGRKKLLKSDW
ncbi:MAG: ABC transporter permease [Bacteroidetes bacterium]|nr:ABC transporter permease [Bacteroidota bacterium]MBS1739763.1 ABC transporter permease [Bacteroidota bacterium]